MRSLISTAKLNNVDSQALLADELTRIAGTPQSRLHERLPRKWQEHRRHDQAAQLAAAASLFINGITATGSQQHTLRPSADAHV